MEDANKAGGVPHYNRDHEQARLNVPYETAAQAHRKEIEKVAPVLAGGGEPNYGLMGWGPYELIGDAIHRRLKELQERRRQVELQMNELNKLCASLPMDTMGAKCSDLWVALQRIRGM